jgi:ADP-L-glycero-D-manno-heptose 6-epimerase
MNILITGCNGFIGKNMMSYLNQQPDWVIEGWDWNPNKSEWPDVTGYDWVIHLGAIADMTETDVEKIMFQNYDFSCWLFNQCQRHRVNLQYASSSSVYGNTKDFSEYAACNPQTPYAWSKFLFDRWVFQQTQYSFVQGFRYFNVYGKWMYLRGSRANAIYKWRQQARKQGYVEVWENADKIKRDWTWVGDVCKVHLDFINSVKGSGIWNVGSGLSHSFLDIAEYIAEQEQVELKTVPIPELEKARWRQMTCADLSHLKETVGKRKWLNVYEWLDLEV